MAAGDAPCARRPLSAGRVVVTVGWDSRPDCSHGIMSGFPLPRNMMPASRLRRPGPGRWATFLHPASLTAAFFCLLFFLEGLVFIPYLGLQNDEAIFSGTIYPRWESCTPCGSFESARSR